jgi:hypothetical protein
LYRGAKEINAALLEQIRKRKEEEAFTVESIRQKMERIRERHRQNMPADYKEPTDHYAGRFCFG